jgi:protein ImuA
MIVDKALARIELEARIGALQAAGRKAWGVVPLGCPALDGALAEGGLARAGLAEIGGASGAATGFAAFLMARLAAASPMRWVLWCGRRDDLYVPGLRRFGLDPAHLLYLQCRTDRDVLWAMEEGLRARALAAVLGEARAIDLTGTRRLQLAAEGSGTAALLLVPEGEGKAGANGALTRWRVAPAGGSVVLRWRIELMRAQGGRPGDWLVEWCDATGDLALAALAGERSADARSRATGR